jgi:hypothetical protein
LRLVTVSLVLLLVGDSKCKKTMRNTLALL